MRYYNDQTFWDRQALANSADLDQTTLHEEQSDQGQHYLPFHLHLLDKFSLFAHAKSQKQNGEDWSNFFDICERNGNMARCKWGFM